MPNASDAYARNAPFIAPGPHNYNASLAPGDELAFRLWTAQHAVPFDTEAPVSDYDMRGFFQGLRNGDPRAQSAVDPNDGRLHYPDFWKTPYHATFSNQSQFATPDAPHWTPDEKLVGADGQIVFDDRAGSTEPSKESSMISQVPPIGMGASPPPQSPMNTLPARSALVSALMNQPPPQAQPNGYAGASPITLADLYRAAAQQQQQQPGNTIPGTGFMGVGGTTYAQGAAPGAGQIEPM